MGLFDDELSAINRKINNLENQIAEEFDEAKNALLSSLRTMKIGVERKIQEQAMERDLNEQFDQLIEQHKPRFDQKGNQIGVDYLTKTIGVRDNALDAYEAESSKQALQSFEKCLRDINDIRRDFLELLDTCKTRGFF